MVGHLGNAERLYLPSNEPWMKRAADRLPERFPYMSYYDTTKSPWQRVLLFQFRQILVFTAFLRC